MSLLGTRKVAERLGVSTYRLSRAVWDQKIDPPPEKGPGGAFVWTEADVRRASWILLRRDLPEKGT